MHRLGWLFEFLLAWPPSGFSSAAIARTGSSLHGVVVHATGVPPSVTPRSEGRHPLWLRAESADRLEQVNVNTSLTTLPTSTVTGAVTGLVTSYLKSTGATAVFTGQPLLTGTCASPYFALVTGDESIEFPQIGCAGDHEECCPFNFRENALLSVCPQDYSTITFARAASVGPATVNSSGCCPSGWSVWYTGISNVTPCYTPLSTPLVPVTTPSLPNLQLITGAMFARKFDLATSAERTRPTTQRHVTAIAGSICGVSVLLIVGAVILVVWHRRVRLQNRPHDHTAPPSAPPGIHIPPPCTAVELASPEAPKDAQPPGYSPKTDSPEELPGSEVSSPGPDSATMPTKND